MPSAGSGEAVVIVGSVALDTVATPFGRAESVLGGSATYAALAASFFSPVRLVAVVGEDFPEAHLEALRQRGVDLSGVEIAAGATFRWEGYYEFDLNQAHTVSTQLNVFERFRPKLPPAYRDTPYLFLANIDPELQLSVCSQVHAPRLTICDTMNYWIVNKRPALLEMLRRAEIVLMNDAEARQLCETPNLVMAARQVLAMGPRAVIIKKGEHGALLFTPEGHFSAPSYPLETVRDPTGAGDTFAGALIGYLAYTNDPSEDSLRQAIVYGSVMASYNVEDFGPARLLRLTHEEIIARYREFGEIARFAAV